MLGGVGKQNQHSTGVCMKYLLFSRCDLATLLRLSTWASLLASSVSTEGTQIRMFLVLGTLSSPMHFPTKRHINTIRAGLHFLFSLLRSPSSLRTKPRRPPEHKPVNSKSPILPILLNVHIPPSQIPPPHKTPNTSPKTPNPPSSAVAPRQSTNQSFSLSTAPKSSPTSSVHRLK